MKKYPTDLTDSQWNHIKEMFPPPKATGRPREVEFREIFNAILYYCSQVVNGGLYRMIIRRGALVTVILGRGKMSVCGIGYTKPCVLIYVGKKDGISIRQPVHWIRKVLKQPPCRPRVDLMRARK